LATKLEAYNGALVLLGARTLNTTSDSRTERYSLDRVWSQTLDYMLEAGLWNFAARTDELGSSDTVETYFGYEYVFEKPDDYIRIMEISENERFSPTLEDFAEEGDYILADCDPMYIKYVSNSTEYGADPGKWSASFTAAFIDELAYRTAPQITSAGAAKVDWLEKKRRRSLYYAKGKDAVNQPRAELPAGRLIKARSGTRFTNTMRRTPYA
jgi:hypothetical protein